VIRGRDDRPIGGPTSTLIKKDVYLLPLLLHTNAISLLYLVSVIEYILTNYYERNPLDMNELVYAWVSSKTAACGTLFVAGGFLLDNNY
jgi:hypothetical protein